MKVIKLVFVARWVFFSSNCANIAVQPLQIHHGRFSSLAKFLVLTLVSDHRGLPIVCNAINIIYYLNQLLMTWINQRWSWRKYKITASLGERSIGIFVCISSDCMHTNPMCSSWHLFEAIERVASWNLLVNESLMSLTRRQSLPNMHNYLASKPSCLK